jgi:methionyl-tRNA formyltransferase
MRIVLMGSPDFGIPSFKAILESGYDVPAVVTVPDKQKGRGLKVQQSDVKKFALENNIEVLQPESLKETSFIESLKLLEPDLFIIIAFRILPPAIFKIPRLGSINLHASLLPKYRGAAPINWAIINGEKVSGITTFFLDDKVDTGNIILQKEIPIDINETFGDVYYKMSESGSPLMIETIEKIKEGNFELLKQDNTLATKAPKIFRKDCLINWNDNAINVHNFIRGLSPVPAAYTTHNGKMYKILKSALTEQKSSIPGKLNIEGKKLLVNTSDFDIEILKIQPEGKKPMSASDFINGMNKSEEIVFGSH